MVEQTVSVSRLCVERPVPGILTIILVGSERGTSGSTSDTLTFMWDDIDVITETDSPF